MIQQVGWNEGESYLLWGCEAHPPIKDVLEKAKERFRWKYGSWGSCRQVKYVTHRASLLFIS